MKTDAPWAHVETETHPRDVPAERLKVGNIVGCVGDELERVKAQLPDAQASKWT